MRFGLLISALMHASLVLLVAFGLPYLRSPVEPTEAPIMLELVTIGEITTPQTPPTPAPKPVDKADSDKEAEPEPAKDETPLTPPQTASAPPPPKLALAKPPRPPKVEAPAPAPAPKPAAKTEPPPPPPMPTLEKKPPTPPKPPKLALAAPAPSAKPETPEPPPQSQPKPRAEKAPTPTMPKVPAPPAPEQKFEKTMDRIALLLDKSKKTPPSPSPQATRPQARAAPAGPQATAGGREERQLTIREIDAIRLIIQRQIENCWDVPAGARDAANLAVKVSFSLRPDGSLSRPPEVENDPRAEAAGGPFYRAAAESARRAVLKCTPLAGLPPDSYEYWRDVTLNFNPREILGQ